MAIPASAKSDGRDVGCGLTSVTGRRGASAVQSVVRTSMSAGRAHQG